MTIYKRPDELVFAESAKNGEVAPFPDIPRGWGITFDQTEGEPPMEWMNGVTKQQFEAVRYFMQRGVSEWSATEDYPLNALVQFEGLFYISLLANKGKPPKTSIENWISFDRKYALKADIENIHTFVAGQLVPSFTGKPLEGTLPCYGGTVLVANYPKYAAAVGTRYGGDGVNTVGLPNISDGLALLASGSSADVGAISTGDNKSHVHTAWSGEAGVHTHFTSQRYYSGAASHPSPNNQGTNGSPIYTDAQGNHVHAIGIGASGGANNLAAGMKILICVAF